MEVEKLINAEIEKIQAGESDKKISQMLLIQDEIRSILKGRTSMLTYPRIIVDSWEYKDRLGIKLLSIASLYQKKMLEK